MSQRRLDLAKYTCNVDGCDQDDAGNAVRDADINTLAVVDDDDDDDDDDDVDDPTLQYCDVVHDVNSSQENSQQVSQLSQVSTDVCGIMCFSDTITCINSLIRT